MKLCDYGCGQEAKHQFKNGKWCCSKHVNQCPYIKIKKLKSIENVKYYNNFDKLCDYGCGQIAKYQFKNGKYCCSKSYIQCSNYREKCSIRMQKEWGDPNNGLNSVLCKERKSQSMKDIWEDPTSIFNSDSWKEKQINKMKDAWQDPTSIFNSISYRENISKRMIEEWADSNSAINSIIYRERQSKGIKDAWKDPNNGLNTCKEKRNKSLKLTIEKINEKYPFFTKIEEMRYNPDKPGEKEIQVHCKNHNCKNSKEKGGWFTPTYNQLSGRINALEKDDGNDGNYFYCSQYCKDTCILYRLQGDPYKETNKPYTSAELEIFNNLVLKRDDEICYYCGEHHATIVHHLRPKKLEPFFALDPDYAISVCIKCHYKYGHPSGSEHSTGNLAKIVCSVESQKFLNQTLEDI